MAILFADIVGFTALSERLDPEEVHALVQECLGSLAAVVTEHGGYVDKFIGDSIMALFGAPVAHEDDVSRAVAAALAMQVRMGDLDASMRAEYGVSLALRIGINAGLVVAGELGRAGDYTVIGDAVNVASRVQGLAQPGSVVVTAPVRVLAEGPFTFVSCGVVHVKNRSAPVEMFEVRETAPRPVPERVVSQTLFVGRVRELERLHEALKDAVAGRGSALWLVAEAGMGKSRLVEEFLRTANPEAAPLVGHCRAYAAPLYLPYREWFGQMDAVAHRIGIEQEQDWQALLPTPEDFSRLYASLFPEQAGSGGTDPETTKHLAQRTMVRFMRQLAQRTPLLLVIEDLHWADTLTLELADALAREVDRVPVLLVGTMRPDQRTAFPGAEMTLGPIETEDLQALLAGLLAPHEVTSDAARWLITATQGNPFFLEELTVSMRTSSELILHQNRWILSRSLSELRVPDTVRSVVQARIDALDPLARTVVRELAVLGPTFDERVAGAISSVRGALEEALDRLEEIRILVPRGDREANQRSFHQGIIQQVAYESLLTRRRRELHERAAREIESLYSGREEEVLDDLAEHFSRAEARVPAVHYLTEAAIRAQGLYANDRARSHYTRILELIAGAPAAEHTVYRDAGVRAECGLADLDSLVGDLDGSVARLTRLAQSNEGLDPVLDAGIQRRLGAALAKQGETEAAFAALSEVLRLCDQSTSVEGRREAARAWHQQAVLHYRRSEYDEALEALDRSAAHSTAIEDASQQADGLLLRGLVNYDTGRRHAARKDLEAALRGKEALGDLRGMAAALNNLGNLETDEGDFAEARHRYEAALALRERIGQREGIAAAEINLANVALSMGDWPEAQRRLETAQALCEEIGDAYGALAAAANRGRLALETGQPREARRRYQAAYERAQRLEFANLAIDARIGLAEAELALGEGEKALATAEAARDEARSAGDPMLVAAATRACAMIAAATGRSIAAATDFAASRRAFRELEQPLEEARTLTRWAEALDDTENARELAEEAESIARRLGAAGELERLERLRTGRLSPPIAPGTRRR